MLQIAHVAPARSVGKVRAVLVANRRQALSNTLHSLAAVVLLGLAVGGFAFEGLRIYEEPGLLGTQAYALGPLFVIAAFVQLIAVPPRVGPRRTAGSWARAMTVGPDYQRTLRRELHIPALYRSAGYTARVSVAALVWVGAAVAYAALFNEVWTDDAVTVRGGAYISAAVIAVGLLAAVGMWPTRGQTHIDIDEQGNFVDSDVPEQQSAPSVSSGVSSSPPTQPPRADDSELPPYVWAQRSTAAPVQVTAPTPVTTPLEEASMKVPTRNDSRGVGRALTGALLGSVLTIGVIVAIIGYFTVFRGEAADPNTIADQFQDVGIVCQDRDKIYDDRDSKALGCRTDDAKLVKVMTYADRPSVEEWLDLKCEEYADSAKHLKQGYLVVGEDYIVDLNQMPVPDNVTTHPLKKQSQQLAGALDATLTAYDCTTR
jgi:hypothetical protein